MAQIKVRARAVDMLGRQQIAGIPTAIHELLKNAHDAYAESVEVDYYRADRMLIIRDDGVGMPREDFETRWLTLGTESKVGANAPGAQTWTGPRRGPARPIMGEKGIGRLAIAAIGPQVLVLTRAVRPDGLHPLVAALVNWRLFEVPGIDLDSIHIPIVEMANGLLPGEAVLAELAAQISMNLDALRDRVPEGQARAIRHDLELLRFNPVLLQSHFPEPHLGGDRYGTHFYIRPSATILSDDVDAGSDDAASPLEKMLLGFSNTMMPDRDAPLIHTSFRDRMEDGRVKELIGGDAFFTPEEFSAADHHIEGTFDAFGQFAGSVSVYHQPPAEHVIQWSGSTGHCTECGPFRIKFAYVQGRASESRLPADDYARISQKLNRIGGLYVYRDGIRILPYGNSDFDFLNIERRRTKSAQEVKKRAATTASSRLRREIGAQVKELSEAVDMALRDSITRLSSAIEGTFADLGRTDTGAADEAALRSLQLQWETRIDESAAKRASDYEGLRDQLVSVAEAVARNES